MPLHQSILRSRLLPLAASLAVSFSAREPVQAQYLGVTCGYDYGNELIGPYGAVTNTPLYNPVSTNPNATWNEWAAQLKQAGVDFVCPNLEGSQPNISKNPTNIAPFVTALNNQGNVTKLAIFDDNATSWVAQNSQALGHGFGTTFQFDISDTNNWKYIYDYNYKLFYQTVPDTNRFKINGRPLIIIWTGNKVFLTNMQGNASRAMAYVRQRCQADFGFNPFIVLSQDFFPNDTTCSNTATADGGHHWYVPPSQPGTFYTFYGTGIGALAPSYQVPSYSNYMPANNGATLSNALVTTVGGGALLTLCEGFTDWSEECALLRVRNLDPSGNPLTYNQTWYDYPNERIDLLRRFSNWPYPVEMRFEAEGCDTFGGANGGNGLTNFYRNGNIAIETNSDTPGGGWDVGWTQTGEWLQWSNVPIQGTLVHLQARVACPQNNCQMHFVIDGAADPELAVPNTGSLQSWATVSSGPYPFSKNGRHTVRLVCDTGGFNLDYWQYHNDIPIGVNLRLLSTAFSKWVSAAGGTLTANVTSPGATESFTVVDASAGLGYGYVALLAQANGKYVTVYTNGATSLAADAASVGPAQLFQWTDNGDGTISLRGLANSKLISATNSPAAFPLIATLNRNPGATETFSLTAVSTNVLSFVAQPNTATVNTAITAGTLGEVQVLAMDASNHPVAGAAITLNLGSGAGIITGNSAVTDGSGIAHYPNLQINLIGAKTLVASSSALAPATSGAFNLTAGTPASLTVETQPDGSGTVVPAQTLTAGGAITAYAILRDSVGNFATNAPAAWSLINRTGGVANGDLAPTADGRSATFTAHLTGSAQISAAGSFTGQSGVQTVTGGAAANLVVTQQPSATAKVGMPFAQQPVVTSTDAFGNPATSPVTATLTGGGGTVSGQPGGIAAVPVNGIATFSGLFLTNLGTSTLTFISGSATATSGNIMVGIGNAVRLAWTTQPGNATNGHIFGTSPVIQTMDAGGNLTALGLPAVKYVSVSLYAGGGTLLGNVITNIGTSGGNGWVALTNLSLNATGTFQLNAQDIGNAWNPTNISAAASCQLWLDAADGATLNTTVVGAGVTQWNDKSGKTNNATGGATLAIDPLLTATSPGQAQTIHFNGSQQLTMNLSSLSNSPYTIFVLEVGAAKASGSAYFLGNNGGFSKDLTLGVGYQTPAQFRWQQYSDDLNYNATLSSVAARQWTMNLNPTPTKNLYLNSSLVGTAASSYLTGANLVNGTVGYNSYLGDLAEIVVYNTSLNLNDQTNLQTYLNNKWLTGLAPAATRPFVVSAPVYYPFFSRITAGKNNGVLSSIAFAGAGGPTNGAYRVLTSTNAAAALPAWTPVLTNAFDAVGAFSNTLPVKTNEPVRFYRLVQP